jgi:hypothetical protein
MGFISRNERLVYLVGVFSFFNFAVTGLFLWMFFAGNLEIRTKKLVVVDKNRVERIHLDPESADVRVFGKVFKRRSAASGLVLFNPKGDETGGFVVLEDGTVSATIDSYDGEKVSERVSMFHMGDGESGFLVKDIDNQMRMRAQLNKNGAFELKIFDRKEKELKSLIFE